MAENGFTFWANMKETIDRYANYPDYQLKMYDALTEYGLYGTWPEDDGTKESADLMAFIQSMTLSLDKSRNYNQKCEDSGKAGGGKQKYSDDQLIEAIKTAAYKKQGVPTRTEVVNSFLELYNIKISEKTVSRRFNDEEKKKIAEGHLETLKDVLGTQGQDKDNNDVPGTLETLRDMSQGHKDVPDVPGNVNKNKVSFNF